MSQKKAQFDEVPKKNCKAAPAGLGARKPPRRVTKQKKRCWIELVFYNATTLHSTLDYTSPMNDQKSLWEVQIKKSA